MHLLQAIHILQIVHTIFLDCMHLGGAELTDSMKALLGGN